jgi:hypothetical protein
MKNALISAVAAVALTATLLPATASARPSAGSHWSGGGHYWSGGRHWNGEHVARGWRGYGYRHRYRGPGIAFGFAAPYAYAYGGSCYRTRRVLTPWGWRFRRVWVC